MAHRIVILGAGTGGTLTANRLRKEYSSDEATITVVDQDDQHVYQPGLLFVPFGLAKADDIVRPRHEQLHKGIDYHQSPIDRVDLETDTVHLADGTESAYDLLVVATGATLVPEETEGLTGPGWGETVHTFYTLEGATALERALADFDGGRLVDQRRGHAHQVPGGTARVRLPRRLVLPRPQDPRPGRDHLRHPARRRVHQARRRRSASAGCSRIGASTS